MRRNDLYFIMTIAGAILLMGTTVFVLLNWTQMPEQIPLHYNFSGEVTDYGGKGAIVPLLLVAWGMFLLLTVIVKFPNTWNIPVKVTKENAERIYGITRGMLEAVKFESVLLMAATIISAVKGDNSSLTVMTILIAVMLITVAMGIYLLYKNK